MESTTPTRHLMTTVDGHPVFYRTAGPEDGPVVVLLHGFPTSSFMFRNLIPLLADRYRVVAPDLLGFGFSDAPAADDFPYTFDALADVTAALLRQLSISEYALYVQDYGAPIGWRLALAQPAGRPRITAIVSQNGNAYEEGFVSSFWDPLWAYAGDPGPRTEKAMRGALELDTIRWQYTHGVEDPSLVDPDAWTHDHALVSRPGNDEVQLALFRDYASNRTLYPRLHEWFRGTRIPLLAVWGAGDEIFGPDGARAFRADLPDAEVHLLSGAGHFALESHLHPVASQVRDFLARVLPE